MTNLIKKLFYKYEKFIKFAIVGFGNLFISLITYYILVFFSINYQIANIGGFITGSLNGYIWNRIWVFKNSKKKFIIYCKILFLLFKYLVIKCYFIVYLD